METEMTQINKIENGRGDHNKHEGNPGNHRDYYESIYPNKLENQEEIDKFIDIYDHPKWNQNGISHLK
jgi:hypothetical protein